MVRHRWRRSCSRTSSYSAGSDCRLLLRQAAATDPGPIAVGSTEPQTRCVSMPATDSGTPIVHPKKRWPATCDRACCAAKARRRRGPRNQAASGRSLAFHSDHHLRRNRAGRTRRRRGDAEARGRRRHHDQRPARGRSRRASDTPAPAACRTAKSTRGAPAGFSAGERNTPNHACPMIVAEPDATTIANNQCPAASGRRAPTNRPSRPPSRRIALRVDGPSRRHSRRQHHRQQPVRHADIPSSSPTRARPGARVRIRSTARSPAGNETLCRTPGGFPPTPPRRSSRHAQTDVDVSHQRAALERRKPPDPADDVECTDGDGGRGPAIPPNSSIRRSAPPCR
jgi:hypothetical protein